MRASHHAGQPYNTDATAAPTGGHPISIVVTDDTTIVAYLGNAGRPSHLRPAKTNQQKQPSRHNTKKGLDKRVHTGNDDYELLGSPGASAHLASQAENFMQQIDTHLAKGADITVLDLTGFTPGQIEQVQHYLAGLDPTSLDKLWVIGG